MEHRTTIKDMKPTVLQDLPLIDFINFILEHHTLPTTIVICASRDAFLQQLLRSESSSRPSNQSADNQLDPETIPEQHAESLLIPTLHLLSTSRTVDLAFCPSLHALQAYLSAYSARAASWTKATEARTTGESVRTGKVPILALLNPLALHRETSSFSAQGLSRTFASAVEAADRNRQKLIIAECVDGHVTPENVGQDEGDEAMEDVDVRMAVEAEAAGTGSEERSKENPWDQEVGILNVTTRTFGAGERGWVGRTVKIRRVAERWCVFKSMKRDDSQHCRIQDEQMGETQTAAG
ncbi:hypothetical protein H2199_003538 [Coniosporium tulheliwenetii]|uniref:Uncharacterized protein n=1 Tax=Coniosporium tulheliwenetii TaxID=3383036 RepID=A0ACC2ZB92_9PEZI|nr:hypothetical protein H2199_003538 [Cladosporium sp. JES 115]